MEEDNFPNLDFIDSFEELQRFIPERLVLVVICVVFYRNNLLFFSPEDLPPNTSVHQYETAVVLVSTSLGVRASVKLVTAAFIMKINDDLSFCMTMDGIPIRGYVT